MCKAVESKRDDDAESSGSFWEDDPGLRRNVSILIGSQIMLNIGVSQVVPVLPILATEMGLGATGIGMLMAAPAVARLALNLPYGRMADTIGRKPLMRWGTLATASGSIATGLLMHSGLAPVLASRLLVGAGTAASMTGSSAMMADITDAAPRHRTSIMALQSFVLSGVWVVGRVLGGLLAEAHGARNSFYLAGVGVGLCSIGYSQLPETLIRRPSHGLATVMDAQAEDEKKAAEGNADDDSHGSSSTTSSPPTRSHEDGSPSGTKTASQSESTSSFLHEIRPLLHSGNIQSFSALALASNVSNACFMVVLTLHARHLWEATPADIGWMFSLVGLSYVAGGPAGGWLSNRFGRKALIVPGLALSHVCFGGLALVDSREAFYGLLLLSYISAACTSPALATLSAEVVPAEQRGQASSISRMAGDVASFSAPVCLGLLADYTSCGAAILTTAGMCSVSTAFFAVRASEVSDLAGKA